MHFVILAILLIVGNVLAQYPCNLVASDGSTYDLTRLAALGTISATDNFALWTYTISICGNRVSCGDGITTGYCQYGEIGGRSYYFNVGYLDQTIPLKDGMGVELIYFDPREQKAGRVVISCDPKAIVSNLTAVTPENPLDYEFRFSSIAGCSTVPPCHVESPSTGKFYDLSDFIGTSPITASDDVGQWQYSVSVCQNSIARCAVCNPSGYCQTSISGSTSFCVGTFGNITGNDDGTGVVLYYEEPSEGRKGQLHITCDPQAGLVTDITAISPPVKTDYAFYFKSYAACPQRPPCKVTSADGSNYDLDALVLHPPISAVDDKNFWNYTVSICQNSLSCANINPAGYCQFQVSGFFQYCIGTFDSIQGLDNGQGVKLTYKEPVEERLGTVTISCDPNGPIVGSITAISPDSKDTYEFNFKSNAACPKK